MPSHVKSPYAASFTSAIKKGTPAGKAVEAIARRNGAKPAAIFNSLYKAGLCQRQKFNGQWLYWPCQDIKTSATSAKAVQIDLWQNLIDWCIVSGHGKPQQLTGNTGSQSDFMSYCRKFFSRQITTGTTGTRKRTGTKRRTTARSRTRTTSYKFPRSTSTSRRYRRAA